MKLLTVQNAKTVKGEKKGYLTGILYLAPHRIAGNANVCPKSTAACRAACLYTAGRGKFTRVQTARVRKTNWLFYNRSEFLAVLEKDILALQAAADRKGLEPCVRLNGTSDLPWYSRAYGAVMDGKNCNIQFYDYTKDIERVLRHHRDNYHLTFSYTGHNKRSCLRALEAGRNVAVVFKDANFPDKLWGYDVVSGDETDLRFLDPSPCIVGLKAKGEARKINSSFVLDL